VAIFEFFRIIGFLKSKDGYFALWLDRCKVTKINSKKRKKAAYFGILTYLYTSKQHVCLY
jgi:hypothetical protein